MKPDNWLARPRKDRTPVISVGVGNFDKATILTESGLTPLALIIKPASANFEFLLREHYVQVLALCSNGAYPVI